MARKTLGQQIDSLARATRQQINGLARTTEQQIDSLARMTQRGFLDVQKRFKKTDEQLEQIREEMVTKKEAEKFVLKAELRETEERLLFAIESIEVKKHDFDALADDVDDLDHRVGVLEKKR